MAMSFPQKLRPSQHTNAEAAAPGPPEVQLVNWRAVRRAAHACCCMAGPVVVAVLPPAPGRQHRTEILLCGHHYRVSRPALAAARAVVVDMTGVPTADYDWPEDWGEAR